MRRCAARLASLVVLLNTALLLPLPLAAQSLSELFQKAKAQVKGESWPDAMQTLDRLEAESAMPGNEAARSQLEAPMAFYRGVCEANLGQAEKAQVDFETFLLLQPNASMDPSMYSKKAIAAFEAAGRNVAPPDLEGQPSMFLAFQEFRLPPNSGEPVNETWGDGPVKWLMTGQEKRRWSELVSGAEWQEFVDKFWESRNPKPGNPDNTFKTGFDRRVAFADANFVQAEGTRGSMTDRGMVFVLLGPPTYVGRRPIRTGEDANEAEGMSSVGSTEAGDALKAARNEGKLSGHKAAAAVGPFTGPGAQALEASANWRETWHYRKELLPKGVRFLQVDIEFITKKGYGVNVLQRATQTISTLEAAREGPKGPS